MTLDNAFTQKCMLGVFQDVSPKKILGFLLYIKVEGSDLAAAVYTLRSFTHRDPAVKIAVHAGRALN